MEESFILSPLNKKLVTIDPIYGHIFVSDVEAELVESSDFKRLRRIKQLSFAQRVYPSATHTRFGHSLGTRHMCNLMCRNIIRNHPKRSSELDNKKNLLIVHIASLLHDIGHSAFSHSTEQITNIFNKRFNSLKDHEEATYLKITSQEFEINKILKRNNFSDDEIKKIANIATGNLEKLDKNEKYFTDIITGDFGCDRIEYLKRDSYFAGTSYGSLEASEILNYITIREFPDGTKRLAIKFEKSRGGIEAATFLLLCRQFHFSRIAHQDSTRKANAMLARALVEFIEKDKLNQEKEFIDSLFFQLDDYELLNQLRLSGIDRVKKYAESIWDESYNYRGIKHTKTKRMDDFPPEFRYFLILINSFGESYNFEKICEEFINNKYKLRYTIIDLNVNGIKGIPTEVYIEVDEETREEKKLHRSISAFDKSPTLFELAISLAKTGTFSIYSTRRLDDMLFGELFNLALNYTNKLRKRVEVITSEFLLYYIYKLGYHFLYVEPKYRDTLIQEGIPGLGRLMSDQFKITSSSKSGLFSNWVDEVKGRQFDIVDMVDRPFYMNKQILREIFILMGMQFITIFKKPIGFEENHDFHSKCWKYNEDIVSMIDRWDFHITPDGREYIKNRIPKVSKDLYDEILENLKL